MAGSGKEAGKRADSAVSRSVSILVIAMLLMALAAAGAAVALQRNASRDAAAEACEMALHHAAGTIGFYTRMADVAAMMALDYYNGYSSRIPQEFFSSYPAIKSISVYESRDQRIEQMRHDGGPLLPEERERLEAALRARPVRQRYIVMGRSDPSVSFILSYFSSDAPDRRGVSGYVALKVDTAELLADSGSLAPSDSVAGYEVLWRDPDGTVRHVASSMDGVDGRPDVEASLEVNDSLGGESLKGTLAIRAVTDYSGLSAREPIAAVLMALVMTLVLGRLYGYTMRLRCSRDAYVRLSRTDQLTGLLNRQGAYKAVAENLDHGVKAMSVIAMDLDEFKRLNDVYGHALGDEALRVVARELRGSFGRDAIIVRSGGDEFELLLPGVDEDGCRQIIEGFSSREHRVLFNGQEVSFSVSMGLAMYPGDGDTIKKALACADAALYNAKGNGRRRWSRYEPRMAVASRINLGFNFNDIAHGCPAGIVLYRDDGKGEILYANPFFRRMCGCGSFDELSAFAGGTFEGLVAPGCREGFLRGIAYQKGRAEYGQSGYSSFRVLVRGKGERSAIGAWKVMDSEYYGKLMYMLVIDSSELDSRSLALALSKSLDLN